MTLDVDHADVIIVGCGLSGSVMAERFATVLNKKVLILEKRNHIGGNCFDFVDETTGILCSKYGPHFFHTNDETVWNYIQEFASWERYEHKGVASVDGKLVPVPVNITTVNMLCGENIQTEEEMEEWLKHNQMQFDDITNGEEMTLSRVGKTMYEKIFRDYTFKQWAKYPHQLKPEVLARIPLRKNFDARYFTDKYQVLPTGGYTKFFERLLDHPNITVHLEVDFFTLTIPTNKLVIYTGPIDTYFADVGYECLEYRSLDFVFEIHENTPFYQTHTQVNYPSFEKEFTRITEYKHPYHQQSPHTIICKEFSCSEGEPYYPVLNERNLELFEKYRTMSLEETQKNNIHFLGRLANYKYFNMDQAIKNSLDYFQNIFL